MRTDARARPYLAFIAVAAAAIAAGGCSTSAGSGASPLSHGMLRKTGTYGWSWVKTVYDTSSGANNTEVTGVNNLAGSTGPEIVGNYFVGGTSPASYAFTSIGPNYTSFTDVSYPRTKSGGTQINAIAPNAGSSVVPILAGFVANPEDVGSGDIFAVVDNQGLWSLLPEPGGGAGQGGTNAGYLFGINDNLVAVGYYVEPAGAKATTPPTAYEVTPPSPGPRPQYTNVPFPSQWKATDSVAYGINDNGDMVGTANATVNSATGPVAWYALCLTAHPCRPNSSIPTSYCWQTIDLSNASNIVAYAINNASSTNKEVVGSFQDAGATHGFLATVSPSSASSIPCETDSLQYPIDVVVNSQRANLTVVRGINDVNDIVGWYRAAGSSNVKGFVGALKGSAKRRHAARRE